MSAFLNFIQAYGTQLSVIGAAVAFLVGMYKYHVERWQTHYWKEFEVFHKLVKELVEPPSEGQGLYVDRQAAIIFELRKFKRYHPYTLRMLRGLQAKWCASSQQFPRLTESEWGQIPS